MEQTIERFRIFGPYHEVTIGELKEILSPESGETGPTDDIVVATPEEQFSVYADVFFCASNELLYDLVTGEFDDEDEYPICPRAHDGRRAEFGRDKLERMLVSAKGVLQKLCSMDPEDEDYPRYYKPEVEWIVKQFETELQLNKNPEIEYCYSCVI